MFLMAREMEREQGHEQWEHLPCLVYVYVAVFLKLIKSEVKWKDKSADGYRRRRIVLDRSPIMAPH